MRSIKAAVLAACLIVASTAHAELIGIVDAGRGTLIELHDTAGPCVGGALHAVYRQALPSQVTVPGCWVMGQGSVRVAFLAADTAIIPVAAVRKPTPT